MFVVTGTSIVFVVWGLILSRNQTSQALMQISTCLSNASSWLVEGPEGSWYFNALIFSAKTLRMGWASWAHDSSFGFAPVMLRRCGTKSTNLPSRATVLLLLPCVYRAALRHWISAKPSCRPMESLSTSEYDIETTLPGRRSCCKACVTWI